MTAPRANARQGRVHAVAIDPGGWVDLLWVGRWNHPDGPEAVTPEDIANCLANLQAEANVAGDSWPGVVFYVGHPETDGTLASAPAKAWAKQFRINSEGRLQGLVEWAGDAKAALIDSRAYKYLSCYEWGDLDDQGTFHPATISSVGLTNAPVKREGQKPLANAGDQAMPDEPDAPTPAETLAALGLAPRPNAIPDEIAAKIAGIIGTAETREDALDAIYQEMSRVYQEESQLYAMETLVSTMANAIGITLPEGDLQARGNALADAMQAACNERDELIIANAVRDQALPDTEQARANALRLLRADPDAAKAHFANAAPAGRAPSHPLTRLPPRRANAIDDPATGQDAAKQVADNIRARANALMPECGGNWDVAWGRAAKEIRADTQP